MKHCDHVSFWSYSLFWFCTWYIPFREVGEAGIRGSFGPTTAVWKPLSFTARMQTSGGADRSVTSAKCQIRVFHHNIQALSFIKWQWEIATNNSKNVQMCMCMKIHMKNKDLDVSLAWWTQLTSCDNLCFNDRCCLERFGMRSMGYCGFLKVKN